MIYVQDLLDDWLGRKAARVILPITDPYVVHHGALGSFATAYLPEGATGPTSSPASRPARNAGGVGKEDAVKRFELPADRIGDIVMISTENMTIGTVC